MQGETNGSWLAGKGRLCANKPRMVLGPTTSWLPLDGGVGHLPFLELWGKACFRTSALCCFCVVCRDPGAGRASSMLLSSRCWLKRGERTFFLPPSKRRKRVTARFRDSGAAFPTFHFLCPAVKTQPTTPPSFPLRAHPTFYFRGRQHASITPLLHRPRGAKDAGCIPERASGTCDWARGI